MDTTPANAPKTYEFNNGQPYCNLAGELLADLMALLAVIKARQPDVADLPGHLVLTMRAGEISVGLEQPGLRIIVLEQIAADVDDPGTFGAPLVRVPRGAPLQ